MLLASTLVRLALISGLVRILSANSVSVTENVQIVQIVQIDSGYFLCLERLEHIERLEPAQRCHLCLCGEYSFTINPE